MAIDKNAVANEARKLAAKGLYDKAIAEWRKLLSESPHDPNLYNTIGDLCMKKNARAEAVDAYKRAADILAQDGFTSKAIALYKKILNIDINKVEVHLALGDMHAEKGLVSNALANYKFVADQYTKQNKKAEALGIYQKMADLNPDNIGSRIKLADMYAKEGMTAEATQAYLAAADAYLSKEALKDARQLFEKILSIDPGNKAVYFKAGVVYLKEGKPVEACKALKPAFENDPDNRELSDIYLEALAKAGKDAEAGHVIEKILAAQPDRADLREKLYPILIAKGEHERALEVATALARGRIQAGDHEGAAEILSRFVSDSPQFIPGRRALAELYVSSGRREDAADTYVQAAKILSAEGDLEGTAEALGKALEIVPGFQSAREMLDNLAAPESPSAPPESPSAPPESPSAPPESPSAPPELMQPAFEEPSAESTGIPAAASPEAAPQEEAVVEDRAAQEISDDPALTEALVEADVLVKYGLTTKAIEQLEAMAQRFPESMQLRVKLRDLYTEQGQMRAAAGQMLAMSDLHAQRGHLEQAEQVLRSALDIDPANDEIRKRLGIAPETAAVNAAPPVEPAAPSLPDLTPLEDLTEPIEAGAPETAFPPVGNAPSHEPAPTEEITIEGIDAGSFNEGLEPLASAALPPVVEAQAAGSGSPLDSPETARDTELTAVGRGNAETFGLDELPAEEAVQPARAPASEDGLCLSDEGFEPERPEKEEAAREDIGEIWAEAEFYFQQGLFNEARKHYGKIIALNPGESRAIDRLAEISREEEDTKEFTKLADAVEELENAPLPEQPIEAEAALSDSDKEAVRSLMKEIAKIKQPHMEPAPPPTAKGNAVAPSPRTAAPPPQPTSPNIAGKTFSESGPGQPAEEEEYFDLGAELAAENSRDLAAKRKDQPGEYFDLASELYDELAVETPAPCAAASSEQSLDEIFEEFKRGVENQSVKEEADTHYNLGVAYREMGLIDDAIAEFILTPEGEPKFMQSRYMLGLCYMEQGNYRQATDEMQKALKNSETTGVGGQDLIGMRFDLGLAYEGAGNTAAALREFQVVRNIDPYYRDVAERIKELQQGDFISLDQLKDDIEKEISAKFLEEGERIEREEKIRKSEKIRN